tara:strand:+ start:2850 stop:5771 length:2922 start_codon:yes stop_codon:yes gene_type:complete
MPKQSKQEKEFQELSDILNKGGRDFAKLMRMAQMEAASTNKTLRDSQKVVRDKFKTLADSLRLTKKENEFQKAARDIGKKILHAEKSKNEYNRKILTLQQRQLKIMGKIDDVATDISDQFNMQTSAIKNGVKQARLLLNPLVAFAGVVALSVKRFFELEKLGKGTARESGLLAMNTTEFSDSIAKVQPDLIAFGASIDDISKASAAVANNFGVLTTETADIVSESVKIGAAFGVQADTMVNVVSEARLLGATMEDISMFTDEVIGSGVQVNKVFEDLKAVSGDSALILAGQTDQLMSQVLEARKLGLNLNDIANAQSASSGFQDMFTKGMKASVLFGKSINLIESTRLRRQGKFVEAREKELEQFTGTRDLAKQALAIENMTLEQKKSFEEITGRTSADTIKDLNRQLLLQGKLTGDAKRIAESELKREQLLQRQLNLQDKLSAIFSKLSVKIGEQLLPYITQFGDYLEGILDEPGKLNEILDKTVGYLKNAFYILTAIKGISFASNLAMLFGGMANTGPSGIAKMSGVFGKGTNIGGRFKAGGGRYAAGTFARGAGASALRVLGPAAAAISVGADVFKLATTKDAKERKKALGGTIGGVLGGAIGAIGGPVGIAIGAGLGQFAGKAIGKYFADKAQDVQDKGKNAINNAFSQIEQMATNRKLKVFKQIDSLVDSLSGKAVSTVTLDAFFSGLKKVGVSAENAQSALNEVGIKEGVIPAEDALKKLADILKGDGGVNSLLGKYRDNLKGVVDEELSKAGVLQAKKQDEGINKALDAAFSESNLRAIAKNLADAQGIKKTGTMNFEDLLDELEDTDLGSKGSADLLMKEMIKSLETQFYLKGVDSESFLKGTKFSSLEGLVQSMLLGEKTVTSGYGMGGYGMQSTKKVAINRLSEGAMGLGLEDDYVVREVTNIKEAISLMSSDQRAAAVLAGNEAAVEELKKIKEAIEKGKDIYLDKTKVSNVVEKTIVGKNG